MEKCIFTSPGLGGILCNWEVCKRPLSHSCVRHTCPDACRVSEVTEGCFLANVHEVKFPRMKVHKSLRKSPPLLSRRLTISNFPMAVTSFKLLLLCSGRGFRQKRYCQESPTSKVNLRFQFSKKEITWRQWPRPTTPSPTSSAGARLVTVKVWLRRKFTLFHIPHMAQLVHLFGHKKKHTLAQGSPYPT